MQPKAIAFLAREAALDKKAEEPILLDVGRYTAISHYFLITHGNSDRQVRAIADHIAEILEAKKVKLWHCEGRDFGQWILLDFGFLIVHVFLKEKRDFYALERLWGEAKPL